MNRETVLAFIATELKDLIKAAGIPANDDPTAFGFVINEAIDWGGNDEDEVNACARFFALRRIEAHYINSGVALPKTFSERMAEAKELCAEYPFAQE